MLHASTDLSCVNRPCGPTRPGSPPPGLRYHRQLRSSGCLLPLMRHIKDCISFQLLSQPETDRATTGHTKTDTCFLAPILKTNYGYCARKGKDHFFRLRKASARRPWRGQASATIPLHRCLDPSRPGQATQVTLRLFFSLPTSLSWSCPTWKRAYVGEPLLAIAR